MPDDGANSDLTVTADNKMVWWGDLGPVALALFQKLFNCLL